MGAVAVQGEARRRDGFDGADRVALDAGYSDEEPLRRVAGHAEVMLERDLRGILHLLVGAVERGAKPGNRHRGRRADLTLAVHVMTACSLCRTITSVRRTNTPHPRWQDAMTISVFDVMGCQAIAASQPSLAAQVSSGSRAVDQAPWIAVGTQVTPAPPAQIRTGPIKAYGSRLGW